MAKVRDWNIYDIEQRLEKVEKKVAAGSYELPIAAADTLGGVKVGNGLGINSETGVLYNYNPYPYTLPKATDSTLGGVKVGNGLSIDAETGVLSNNNPSLAKASASTLGGVKVGSGLSIDADGVLSAAAANGGKWFAGNQNLYNFAMANAAVTPYKNAVYFIPELRAALGRDFELGKVNSGASVSYWDYQRQRSMIAGKIVSKSVANDTGDGDYIIPNLVIPYDSENQVGPEIVLRGVRMYVEDGSDATFRITFEKAYVTNYKIVDGALVELATGFTGVIYNKTDGQYQGEYAGNELTKRYMIDITDLVPLADNINIDPYVFKFVVRNPGGSFPGVYEKAGHLVPAYPYAELVNFFQNNAKGAFISCDIGKDDVYNYNSELMIGNVTGSLDFTITKPFCGVFSDVLS